VSRSPTHAALRRPPRRRRFAIAAAAAVIVALVATVALYGILRTPREPKSAQTPVEAALNAVACTAGKSCLALGGRGGSIVEDAAGHWRDARLPEDRYFYGLTCYSATRCVAVGDRGAVLATADGGESWSAARTDTDEPLLSVSCAGDAVCLAVGEGGVIERSTGSMRTWSRSPSGRIDELVGVTCTTSTHCVALGAEPTMSITEDGGRSWRTVSTQLLSLLQMTGIACSTPSWCVSVGTNSTLAVSSDAGDSWAPVSIPPTGDLRAVDCVADGPCTAVGVGGRVLESPSPGGAWTARATATLDTLNAVACAPGGDCVAVGGGKTVVGSLDGGATWHDELGGRTNPHPVRVTFVGDSASYFLALGLEREAPAYGVEVANRGLFGCGLLRGGPILEAGTPIPGCAGSDAVAPLVQDVAETDPRVAVLVLGRWDLMQRMYDGAWISPGSAGYDGVFVPTLERSIRALSARGARVVILTTPFLPPDNPPPPPGAQSDICTDGGVRQWCEDSPATVRSFNRLLEQGARATGATLVDYASMLDPDGRYSRVVDGVTVRFPDGVHVGLPGADWLAPWILPRLVAVGAA
jgi:photosystem II stability/assembly factor-like uncharacterized protein